MRRTVAAVLVAATMALGLAACLPEDLNLLQRPAEPVVLTGSDLPRIAGVLPDEIVAFSYHRFGGGWKQIPVQVDERHVADMRVIHAGTTQHSWSTLVYSDPATLTGPDPTPTVDVDDEVVFMARDAGGRVRDAGVAPPAGTIPGSGVELRVTDPLAPGQQGWVYLFRHDGTLRPDAGVDYVDYDFKLLAGAYPDSYDFDPGRDPVGNPPLAPTPNANPEDSRARTGYYELRFADRWITDELRIRAPGASGVDVLDRNRTHGDNGVCVRTEQTFAAGHGAFVANIDGPVRAIRDYIGANSGLYTERVHFLYEQREWITTYLRVHPLPNGGPDDFLDFAPAAAGMTYHNDLLPAGVTVDGQPDAVPAGRLRWELYRGAPGAVAIAHLVDSDIPNLAVSSFYVDDSTPDPLPCTGSDREFWGAAGPALVQPMPRTDPTPRGGTGTLYRLTSHRVQHYGGPALTPEDAQRLADHVEHPLETSWTAPWQPPGR